MVLNEKKNKNTHSFAQNELIHSAIHSLNIFKMRVITNKKRSRKRQPKAAGPAAGKGLSMKKVSNWLVFALFVSAIGIGYIWNAYYAERQVQRRDALRKEVKELRDTYYLQKADRQATVRFAEIAKTADTLGLKRPTKPPFRLKLNEKINE